MLILPPIRLTPATYLRMRLMSRSGQPVLGARISFESFDAMGRSLPKEPSDRPPDPSGDDGSVTIGPLPRGFAVMAVDAPQLIRTRLADVRVTGEKPLIERGTVRVDRGATLNIEVVDEVDKPVPGREVLLDDGAAFSPIDDRKAQTDMNGAASFDRLAPGTYRLRARSLHKCQGEWQLVSRPVDMASSETSRRKFVIGGIPFTLRVTLGGIPLASTLVSVAQESAVPIPPPWLAESAPLSAFRFRRPLPLGLACSAATGRDGRVTLERVPVGTAHVTVRLPHSSWTRMVQVPDRPAELAIEIPGGIMPLRVQSADDSEPVSGAAVTLMAGGGRVDAMTTVTGDVLLEGVTEAGGGLNIPAPGYVPFEAKLMAPSGVQEQIALEREPDRSLRCLVVTEQGTPIPDAVVSVLPADPMENLYVASTDAKGQAQFRDVPVGPFRIEVRAEGYAQGLGSGTIPVGGKPVRTAMRRVPSGNR